MGGGTGRGETKIVYEEAGKIRAVRGRLIGEDEHFFTLRRRDGKLRIAKDIVLKIEEGG
jgi:hypothetical protein